MNGFLLFLEDEDHTLRCVEDQKTYYPKIGSTVREGVIRVDEVIGCKRYSEVSGENIVSLGGGESVFDVLKRLVKGRDYRFLESRCMYLVGRSLLFSIEEYLYVEYKGKLHPVYCLENKELSKELQRRVDDFIVPLFKREIKLEDLGHNRFKEVVAWLPCLPEYGEYFESLIRLIPQEFCDIDRIENKVVIVGNRFLDLERCRGGRVFHSYYRWGTGGWIPVNQYWVSAIRSVCPNMMKDISLKVKRDVLEKGIALYGSTYLDDSGIISKEFKWKNKSVVMRFIVAGDFSYDLYNAYKDDIRESQKSYVTLKKSLEKSTFGRKSGMALLKNFDMKSFQLNGLL